MRAVRVDFAAIDRGSGLRRKEQLKTRAKILGYPHVSQLIYDWYCSQGKRPKEIAWALRVSYQSIYRWLAAWGFTTPGQAFSTDYGKASSFRGVLECAPIDTGAVRKLWTSVLIRAVKDIKKGDQTAVAWMTNTKDMECPSFIWVTELLKIDPVAIRKAVLNGQ